MKRILVFSLFFTSVIFSNAYIEPSKKNFNLILDFYERDVENNINLGIKLESTSENIEIFSNNYDLLYKRERSFRKRTLPYKKDLLVIYDRDIDLSLELLGYFEFENNSISFKEKSFNLTVNDFVNKKILNPRLVLKAKNKILTDSYILLKDVVLKNNIYELSLNQIKKKRESIINGEYSISIQFETRKNNTQSRKINHIYYINLFLNSHLIAREELSSIALNSNQTYFLNSQDKSVLFSSLESVKFNEVNIKKGNNILTIEYGDTYGNKETFYYKLVVNE